MPPLRIGIDFDNTLVCYDEAFYRAADERRLLPTGIAHSKQAIRDYLRSIGREQDWTELQGYVYGPGMQFAEAFPGALAFIGRCVKAGVDLCIISHKTQTPYLGEKYDLHEAADQWLRDQGIFGAIGLPRERVFFELSKAEKLARIATERCTFFIDDLPELLDEPDFPSGVRRLLFDPTGQAVTSPDFPVMRSWDEIALLLLGSAERRR